MHGYLEQLGYLGNYVLDQARDVFANSTPYNEGLWCWSEYLPSVGGIESFLHTTPASSEWPQLWSSQSLYWQAAILCSSPRHLILSIKMGNEEFPAPKDSTRMPSEKFSTLHRTVASLKPKWSSQTVPHLPSWYTSTRPSCDELEPLRRTFISVKKCQIWLRMCLQRQNLSKWVILIRYVIHFVFLTDCSKPFLKRKFIG